MGMTKYASCVSLPCIDKPYPSILTFLARRFPRIEVASWQQRILEGKVLDETGSPISIETPYLPQMRLFYFRELEQEAFVPLQEKIVFQNDELLVACKPPFLPVVPSGPYINDCLLNRLKTKSGNDNLVPLHRIDRETAGLVLFSKNRETRGRYGELFLKGALEKTYEALSEVSPCPENSNWTVENRLIRDDVWFRTRAVPGIVNARSRIKLISYQDNRAHFQLFPLTGKKHQLRVHMSGLGFRIMNDRYYPELLPKQEDNLEKPLQLIARKVRFVDPVSGRTMEFESERRLLLMETS
jgi:tRNA pseudouridine32 synthase/23S rRNA pseudouridine746 synthase